jgi:protein-S-isoprenylcysteine O-methyltransferase
MTPLWPFSALVWAHWQVLLNTSNAAWGLSELWIWARRLGKTKGTNADRGSFLVIVVIITLTLLAASWAGRAFPFARLPDGNIGAIRFASGIALMWIGIALRDWSVLTLGTFFRVVVLVQDDHRLITHGPYRFLRNPSYTGALITFLGQGLITGNAVSLAICVAGPVLALGWRIHVEEQALRTRFGDEYARYAGRSWALVPFVW